MSQLALDTDMHWGIVHVCPASHERWRETLPHRRYRMAHIFALWTAFYASLAETLACESCGD